MIDLIISPMREVDVDDVLAIENQSSATPLSASKFITEMSNPTYILLVAKTNDEQHGLRGFCIGQLVSDELHIHTITVDKQSRRQGIGRTLLDELFNMAKTNNVKSATLEVRVSNEPAIDLYRSCGFVEEGIRSRYYADNAEDALIMWIHNLETV